MPSRERLMDSQLISNLKRECQIWDEETRGNKKFIEWCQAVHLGHTTIPADATHYLAYLALQSERGEK